MPNTELPDDANQSDNFPYCEAPNRFAVIRKPDSGGTVIAKFEYPSGSGRLPKAIHDEPGLVVAYPNNRKALQNVTVEPGVPTYTESEREALRLAGIDV